MSIQGRAVFNIIKDCWNYYQTNSIIVRTNFVLEFNSMGMNRYFLLSILLQLVIMCNNSAMAQADTIKYEGVKVIVPTNEKIEKDNTYFFISGGYQIPAWYRVPMIPEFPVNMVVDGNMNVKASGWFAGAGLMKRTRTRFEVGITADFFKTIIPVAYGGQRSTSDWVLEQSGVLTTDVIENNINRMGEVISIRATVRYKIPIGKFRVWGGVSPGTFSSKIYFQQDGKAEPLGNYRQTLLGLNYQAGVDLAVKNKKGKNLMLFTFFSDFAGPMVEERMISLFKPGWEFLNTKGNFIMNPVRLGFAVGFH